jgi:hypothetical protein
LQDNVRVQEVRNLLEFYDLINTVRSPTRITSCTKSTIDVIITNKDNQDLEAIVDELGYSDNLAQILSIKSGKDIKCLKKVRKRQFTQDRVEEFKYVLSKEPWQEVFNQSDVDSSLKAFMDIFLYYFNIALPYKMIKSRVYNNRRWVSKGLLISSKRMHVLNSLTRNFTLKQETLEYVRKHKRIYKRVVREAIIRDNDRYVLESENKKNYVAINK